MYIPKVSILIPLYNSEKYISETISSALQQTWENKEVIIVDDGSTDNSYQIAKSFESEIVKVVQQQNQGACAARNLAFELSTGEYIQYLDADDLLSENKIEKQMLLFANFGNEIATTCKTVRFVYNFQQLEETSNAVSRDYDVPLDYMIDTWEKGDYFGIHAWLFPRQIVLNTGIWDLELRRFQDGEFVIRVLGQINTIKFVGNCEVYYRVVENSISNGNYEVIENARYLALKKIIENTVLPSVNNSAREAVIKNLSNCIYSWHPYLPFLVDSGMVLLKRLDARLILQNDTLLLRFIKMLVGWKRMRTVELYWIKIKTKVIN